MISKNLINQSKYFRQISINIASKTITENYLYSLGEHFFDEDILITDIKNDYDNLYKWKYKTDNQNKNISDKDIYNIIQNKPILSQNKFGFELKRKIQSNLNQNDPLYIWIVLLESFKPQNGRWLYPDHQYSFMPFYDTMAATGVSFSNAWTVGGVTRAGQQGALCGSWTGEASDAFRGFYKYNPICLPELFKKQYSSFKSYFWYAGDLRFDDTQNFWTNHGVDHLTGQKDFDKIQSQTWWGASDKSLFDKIQSSLLTQNDKSKLQLHIVMTLTNHPEFIVMHDLKYPDEGLFNKAVVNMQKTTYYTDLCLENFINFIKGNKINSNSNKTIWDNSLLILINDHGNYIPDIEYPNLKGSPDERANMLTRANLILQGGFVQNTLKKFNIQNMNFENISSQGDIYPTLLDFLNGNHIESISDSLFSKQRRWPVYSEGNGVIFVPSQFLKKQETVLWSRNDLLLNKKVMIPEQNSDYYLTAKSLFRLNEYLKEKGICCKNNTPL